ncbi:hypothetical protein K227x_50120 [Rubripirellula lacrimiformis]|uniref:Curli production assembly/transport component CsgG n=1 Tax=Rubripirellula lacrimiformis TaxID=1930273 RepID=A0A517NHI8_9BACT|nr:hypothetical protein [Rubripirellula lacrimiformis]QDT06601.1 hypothetical protein K227x_50120 [Rubripirellula lacrimiformis]
MSTAPAAPSRLHRRRLATSVALGCITISAIFQSGCLGLASNLMHAVGMDMIPAEYEGFEDAAVAIVTVTDGSQYSNDIASRDLSRRVGEVLTRKVKKIQLVRDDLIEQWRDTNGWDSLDFQSIGKGVNAKQVLAIELNGLRLRDGATLFQGSADVSIKVIDVETGNVVYSRSLDEYTYPSMTGQHTSETTETRFRKLYLSMLANEIGRSFHPYDLNERIALDSKIASQ